MMGAALAQQLPRRPRYGLALFGYGSTLLLSLLTLAPPTFGHAVGWPPLLLMIVLGRATPDPAIAAYMGARPGGESALLSPHAPGRDASQMHCSFTTYARFIERQRDGAR